MRHTYACPMRWADLDALGHVNNVVYVDYLQEARVDWQYSGPETAHDLVMASQSLTYLEPLLFDFSDVLVDLWVTRVGTSSVGIFYEVHQTGPDGKRTVHLRAETVMVASTGGRARSLTDAERDWLTGFLTATDLPRVEVGTARHEQAGHYPVKVRFSDIDQGGIVNNVKHLEFFQEARVAAMGRIAASADLPGMPPVLVVSQQVEYLHPIRRRQQPYDAWTWVARMGTTSVTLEAEIVDQIAGDRVMAHGRFVLVFVDRETGRPTPPPAQLRAAFGG